MCYILKKLWDAKYLGQWTRCFCIWIQSLPKMYPCKTRKVKLEDAKYMTNEDDEVIAEGVVCSTNSKEKVNNIPLGPSAVCIEVVKVFNDNAHLWRPTTEASLIGDAINEKIAWPVLKIDVTTATTTDATQPKVQVCYFICLSVD
ncbi:PREDICTED: uncharacterized protein LOC109127043 [Camelina sativa]|uniref:Uncharacterized protein LOC109127043 n=1 Tax=Camelina sativa TaxID=90675 RepID=A0ABM1QJ01_CAMSA|nr:PREDICTED: uncharacterized protein LOC109127043 [Camelina sativa]